MLARRVKERAKHTHTQAYSREPIAYLFFVLCSSFELSHYIRHLPDSSYERCCCCCCHRKKSTAAVTVALALVAIKSNSLSLPIAALTLNRSLWTKLHLTYDLLCAHVCVRVTVFRLSFCCC